MTLSVQQVLALMLIGRGFAMIPVANNEVMGPAEVREPAIRSTGEDPRTIRVQITALGETRNLQLIPTDADVFSADFQGFIADVDETGNTVLRQIPASRTAEDDVNSKLYTDVYGRASLYVERRNGQIILEGVLDYETRIENDFNRQGRSLDEPVNHLVYVRVAANDQGKCESVVPNVTEPENEEPYAETRALPSLVQPEVLLVLDYQTSVYHKFDMNAMKKYFGIFFNSVNRRYAGFTSPRIVNVITGIIYSKSASEQNFLAYITKTTLNSKMTAERFGRWMHRMGSPTQAPYDIALLMTGLNFENKLDVHAHFAGACRANNNVNLNVGLVSDSPGNYNGIHKATQAMAFLFGSALDGRKIDFPKGNPGALSCPASEGYIMSDIYGSKNKFSFSICSINQIRFTLKIVRRQYTYSSVDFQKVVRKPRFLVANLTSGGEKYPGKPCIPPITSSASCLLNTIKANAFPTEAILPGTLKNLDEQCQAQFGLQYIFQESKLSTVCTEMWCVPKSQPSSIGPALEGSPCGRNKICTKGECGPYRRYK